MRRRWLVPIALFGAAVVTAATASAAPSKSARGTRDNAIRECIAEARAEAPANLGTVSPADPGGGRVETYKSCMVKKGFNP